MNLQKTIRAGDSMSSLEDQLAILIDDLDFRRIDKEFRRFNIFDAIGAFRSELKHSNFKAVQDRDRISIALLSGPADGPLRKKIHDFALQHPSVFVGFVKPGGVHHTTIFTSDLLSARAAETMESEEKEKALKSAWTEFMTKDFPKLRAQLAGLGK
jgi:hypothetical protein